MNANEPLHPLLERIQRPALIVGAAGIVICLISLLLGEHSRQQFFRSWLLAYLFLLGIPLGSCAVLMLQHLTGGAWGLALRRPLETAARTSLYSSRPVRRSALGPPAHAVRSGARIGSGVQKVGNRACGTWKKATPGQRASQNARWKRIATRITGPEASLPRGAVRSSMLERLTNLGYHAHLEAHGWRPPVVFQAANEGDDTGEAREIPFIKIERFVEDIRDGQRKKLYAGCSIHHGLDLPASRTLTVTVTLDRPPATAIPSGMRNGTSRVMSDAIPSTDTSAVGILPS